MNNPNPSNPATLTPASTMALELERAVCAWDSRDYFVEERHFRDYRHRSLAFLEQLHFEIDNLPSNRTVLDVGCGEGIVQDQRPQYEIARRIETYWGVEPDTEVKPASCFQRIWNASLEDSGIPENSVDLAYSQMVLEHVADPDRFMAKVLSILKPGGVFLSLTVNSQSCFGRIAGTCQKLHIQDFVLRLARGKQAVEHYHYPAVYRMNSKKHWLKEARRFGVDVKLAFLEADEWLCYFPKRTRHLCRYLSLPWQRTTDNFTWMFVRVQKPLR